MPTLTIEAKARDYLAEGRIRAEHVDAQARTATFRVQGSAPVPYLVRYTHGTWRCTCPARVAACCHVRACALVAAPLAAPATPAAAPQPCPQSRAGSPTGFPAT